MSNFMTIKEKKQKKRHQVKSQWHYIFWGTATVAVCAGQIFVGSGFRRMAESFDRVLGSPIQLDLGILPKSPMCKDDGMYYPTDPPIKIY